MLEFIRRHQYGIMLVVAILVIIAFGFLYDPNRDAARADAVLSVGGKGYSINEVQDLAKDQSLAQSLGLYQLVGMLNRLDQRFSSNGEDISQDFLTNLLVLRDQKKKAGIEAGIPSIKKHVVQMPVFQNEAGTFDRERYDTIGANLMRGGGITEERLAGIIGDSVVMSKAIELVSAGVLPSESEVDLVYRSGYESLTGSAVYFNRVDFEAGVTVTAEEVAAYYEENKEGLLGTQKRAIDYVFVPNPTDLDKVALEERQAIQNEFNEMLGDLSYDVIQEGADFGAIVKAAGYEVLKQAAFGVDAIPEAIKEHRPLVQAVFERKLAVSPVSDLVPVEGGNYLFAVTEDIPPQVLTLSEAKGQIRETLKNQKIDEALITAADKAQKAVVAGIEAGKAITEAAKSTGGELVDLGTFCLAEAPAEKRSAPQVAYLASELEAGEVSDVAPDGEGRLFVYLAKRELVADEKEAERKEQIRERVIANDRQLAVTSWFMAAKDEALGENF